MEITTSNRTVSLFVVKTNRLITLEEIIVVYSENRTEHVKALCEQNAGF